MTLLTDPTSNLKAALILYGIIGIIVLIILVAGITLLMGTSEDEDEEFSEDREFYPEDEDYDVEASEDDAPLEPARPPLHPLITAALVTALVVSVWVLAGFTTSTNEVCSACHIASVHSKAQGTKDPHGSSDCVACHESGGVFGRYVGAVPARMLHFVSGGTGRSAQADYGKVSSSACSACHQKDIAGVTLNPDTGVRMSHAEPLAAKATCLDCHVVANGVVSLQTVGMRSCLRCHNNVTTSSKCSVCHDKQTAAAARAKTTKLAKAQVTDIKCGGCHDQKKECDSCHGVRMPHTLAFKAYAHARAGAVDFWYNGGKGCAGSSCHSATRRPCTKCHTSVLGHGHTPAMAIDHQTATSARCNLCHIAMANPRSRDFCTDLCHTEAAKQESPR
jgi:hypothetical protein